MILIEWKNAPTVKIGSSERFEDAQSQKIDYHEKNSCTVFGKCLSIKVDCIERFEGQVVVG